MNIQRGNNRENTGVLQFLAVDFFDLTWKIVKKRLKEKVVKILLFCTFLALDNFDLTRKLFIFLRSKKWWKYWSFAIFLAVDIFDFTRKIVKRVWKEKKVKMLRFCICYALTSLKWININEFLRICIPVNAMAKT